MKILQKIVFHLLLALINSKKFRQIYREGGAQDIHISIPAIIFKSALACILMSSDITFGSNGPGIATRQWDSGVIIQKIF